MKQLDHHYELECEVFSVKVIKWITSIKYVLNNLLLKLSTFEEHSEFQKEAFSLPWLSHASKLCFNYSQWNIFVYVFNRPVT